MNSYSTLQECMKFAYIVTGLVFLLSYVLNFGQCELFEISFWSLIASKDGAILLAVQKNRILLILEKKSIRF